MSDQLLDAARTAVEQCLSLQEDETLVVVSDEEREAIAQACATAGREVTDSIVTVTYPPGNQHGEEPPAPVAEALQQADAFLAPTSKSISHTAARKQATEQGARGATLPGITKDVFVTGMQVDYDVVAENCHLIYDVVADAEELHLTSPAGTDLTLRVENRDWHEDTGMVNSPGEFANLPAGEVFISPETAEGTLVIDGCMRPHHLLENPVVFEVRDGMVVDINDEAVADMLAEAASEANDPDTVYNIAELGIGTNTAVQTLKGNILLDEKAAGTAHVAIGHDASIGGNVVAPIHEDGVLRNPRLLVDDTSVDLSFEH